MDNTTVLGIDIGGSALKCALVDTVSGEMVSERYRLPTPVMPTPEEMAGYIREAMDHFDYRGPIGCGFPAKIVNDIIANAANIHPDWIGIHLHEFLSARCGVNVWTINDADCAGLAEFHYNPELADQVGLVVFLTLGTGIGSALFFQGKLLRGSELGHLLYQGMDIEDYAAASIRETQSLSWKEWGGRLNEVLNHIDFLLSPELFILGGGISKDSKKFLKYLDLEKKIKPAKLMNKAGILGAALYCEEMESQTKTV